MNIFGFTNSDVIYRESIFLSGQDIEQRYLKITTGTQIFQPRISSTNTLNYNFLSNTPDVALESELNNLGLNSNINQVLTPYALKLI